jgi:hypothetical protein
MQVLLQISITLLFIILRKTYSIFEGLIDYFEESAFKSRIKKTLKNSQVEEFTIKEPDGKSQVPDVTCTVIFNQ